MHNNYRHLLLLFALLWPSVVDAKPARNRPAAISNRKVTPATSKKLTPVMLRGKIVFLRSGDLWIVSPNGAGARKILTKPFGGSNSGEDITFSPDLSRVVIAYDPPGDNPYAGNTLVSMRVDGTQRRRVAGQRETDEFRTPRFSPDGRRIVYTRWTGKHWGGPMTADADIWIMNADGSGRKRLLGNFYNHDYAHYQARWSRDGRRILYLQTKGAIPESPDAGPVESEAMSIGLDGTGVRRATGQEARFLEVISPDGKQRIVSHNRDSDYGELYIENVDGTHRRRLTLSNAAVESGARFSPDGKSVIFNVRNRETEKRTGPDLFSVWIIKTDGSGLRRLVDGGRAYVAVVEWLR